MEHSLNTYLTHRPVCGGHRVQRLPLPLPSLRGSSGLLWLEVERDGILSISVPVVVSTDQDVVEEVCELDDDIIQGR